MAIYTKKQILRIVEKENVHYVRLQFTDMLGVIKAVEIPVSKLDDALKGKIMFEIAGVDEATAREALRLAMHKLPVTCKFVKKEESGDVAWQMKN